METQEEKVLQDSRKDILKMPDLTGVSATAACDIFLKSEEFYVERALRIVAEMFVERLKNMTALERGVLTDEEMNLVFLNIDNIYDFNNKLKTSLWEARMKEGGARELLNNLGQIMVRYIPFFKLYTQYIKNYRNALKVLDELRKKKSKFAKFLELNEMCAKHTLADLLLTPVTRLPQYLVFLGAIYQGMDKSDPAGEELANAVRAIQGVTDEIAFNLRDQVARKLVITVQTKVFGGKVDLVSPHRYVVKHGTLRVVYPKSMFSKRFRTFIWILFNDCLLHGTRPGRLLSGSPKRVFRLKGMIVSDVPDESDFKYGFRIQSDSKIPKEAQYNMILHCQTQKEKEKWVHDLTEEIKTFAQNIETLSTYEMSNMEFEDVVLRKRVLPPAPIVTGSGGGSGGPLTASPRDSLTPTSPTTMTFPSARPASPSPPSDLWDKKYDQQYQAYYWENKETKAATWDMPEGWTERSPPASAGPARAASPTPPASAPRASGPVPPSAVPSGPKGKPAAATVTPSAPRPPSATPTPTPPTGTAGGRGRPPVPPSSTPIPPGGGGRGLPRPPSSPYDTASPTKPTRAPAPPATPADDVPEAPAMDAPEAPPLDATPSGPPPTGMKKPPPSTAGSSGDLFSSIRGVDKGMLKKAAPVTKSAAPEGGDLNMALKQSLDRYRHFVQEDEEDIDAGGGGDDEEWEA